MLTLEEVKKSWERYCVVGKGWGVGSLQVAPLNWDDLKNNKSNRVYIHNWIDGDEQSCNLLLFNDKSGFNILIKVLSALGMME